MVHPLHTLPDHHAHMPTFQDFASWIQQKSHIARLDRRSRFDKYKASLGQARADAAPKTASSKTTPTSAFQTAQTKKSQNLMPKAKNTPGGYKEYRDATRGNKNPPQATTFNNNIPKDPPCFKCPKKL